uniref:Uncharacterized protein n=1 Tax=Anopheles culicifacies TaxID=139723 RepID=A0A182MFM8_9DIPT
MRERSTQYSDGGDFKCRELLCVLQHVSSERVKIHNPKAQSEPAKDFSTHFCKTFYALNTTLLLLATHTLITFNGLTAGRYEPIEMQKRIFSKMHFPAPPWYFIIVQGRGVILDEKHSSGASLWNFKNFKIADICKLCMYFDPLTSGS